MLLELSRIILFPGNRPGVSHNLSVAKCALSWQVVDILLASSAHPAKAEATGRTITLQRLLKSGLRELSITKEVGGLIGWNGSTNALLNWSRRHWWVVQPIHRSRLHRGRMS